MSMTRGDCPPQSSRCVSLLPAPSAHSHNVPCVQVIRSLVRWAGVVCGNHLVMEDTTRTLLLRH